MCQPGRPGPNGLSHAGSPGRSARHSRQSSGSFLPSRSGSPPRSAKISQHRVAVEPGHGAEGVVGGHREVEVVVDPVDRAGLVEALDQLDDLRDRLDRTDVVRGRQDAQRLHVLAEQLRSRARPARPSRP